MQHQQPTHKPTKHPPDESQHPAYTISHNDCETAKRNQDRDVGNQSILQRNLGLRLGLPFHEGPGSTERGYIQEACGTEAVSSHQAEVAALCWLCGSGLRGGGRSSSTGNDRHVVTTNHGKTLVQLFGGWIKEAEAVRSAVAIEVLSHAGNEVVVAVDGSQRWGTVGGEGEKRLFGRGGSHISGCVVFAASVDDVLVVVVVVDSVAFVVIVGGGGAAAAWELLRLGGFLLLL